MVKLNQLRGEMVFRTQFAIDPSGRIWKGRGRFERRDDSNNQPIWRRIISQQYKLKDDMPMTNSPNQITKLLTLNDMLLPQVEVEGLNKVVTQDGRIFSLSDSKYVDDRPIFVRVVELKNGNYYKLDKFGRLHFNDDIIMRSVEELIGFNHQAVVIKSRKGWMCKTRLNERRFKPMNGDPIEGQFKLIRETLLLTDENLYRLNIDIDSITVNRINIDGVEGSIIDMIGNNIIYVLTDMKRIYVRKNESWKCLNNRVFDIINNHDPLTNLYHDDDKILISTQSGKLLEIGDGLAEYNRYPQLMFKKQFN
jgi:hypothetical protein